MKLKTIYVCTECGAEHKKWSGQCPDCGAWNSITEDVVEGLESHFSAKNKSTIKSLGKDIKFECLNGNLEHTPRTNIGIGELDRVLGGGLVDGSAILIGGDPGIGKSTLLLQTACALAKNSVETTYISGEESVNQIRIRAKRLGLENAPVKLASATLISDIIKSIDTKTPPKAVIIDSIQTVFASEIGSAPGTVSQVRTCANELINIAKNKNIMMFIVSHVTKDGQIAGPKVLEHMVDTVLYFEGDRNHQFRILRSIKNRFGAANEIGVFEMNDIGLSEVKNPSELFLSTREDTTSGSAVFGGMEGTRPILVEVQALISPSYMPSPRRAVIGWDVNRLAMIIAVLSSRFGLNLYDKEVYLNVVGGLKVNEPAVDLAVASALISASKDIVIPKDYVMMGEVGLSGEIRMISQLDARINEAKKLGFKKAIVPEDIKKLKYFNRLNDGSLEFETIKHVRDLARIFKK
ncbi:DNA repair protein RadA [Pseudomonadota bacterium]